MQEINGVKVFGIYVPWKESCGDFDFFDWDSVGICGTGGIIFEEVQHGTQQEI